MLTLKFNYERLTYDLCNALVDAADEAIEHFKQDATNHLKSDDVETESAIFDTGAKKILATCVFYAHSIIESYGTGSLMDMSNEALDHYMNSLFWNPDRKSKVITGRPKGPYLNIFGDVVVSSGTFAGKNVEDVVPAIQPSYAIQNAEKSLDRGLKEGGYVMRILKKHTDEFFENLDTSKYFYNMEV